MSILPIPLANCKSVKEYFKMQGEVSIPRPQSCLRYECRSKEPLWKNGSYQRHVIYFGFLFLVIIYRFRCQKCGKTASCPYGWLIPYRRFSIEMVAQGIENYAGTEITYRDLSIVLSDFEFAEADMDIREEEMYKRMIDGTKLWDNEKRDCRPAHTTVFYWIEFICKRVEGLLMQVQKELVHEQERRKLEIDLPYESNVENPNSDKATSVAKANMLHLMTFVTLAAVLLLKREKRVWQGLRAYFLTKAESCKDLLTNAMVKLSTTHTFELDLF